MNSIGATQDIATDGLAVSILKGEQQHIGNMFQVVGSRLGFIVGGGAILWALDWLNWQSTFIILAVIVLINTIPVLFYREPEHLHHRFEKEQEGKQQVSIDQHSLSQRISTFFTAIAHYLKYFFKSAVLWRWFMVLLTIKVTDGLSGPIVKPLLVDLGLSLSQIGIYITMLGAFAALLGAGLASLCLHFMSRANALLLFSLLKLASLAGFAYLATLHAQNVAIAPWLIYLINALEDMFASMLLVIILTLVMQYSRKSHAGTDFTFQVSFMAMIAGVFYTTSGILGDLLGYQVYLIAICCIGVLVLFPIWQWRKQTLKQSTIEI